MDDVTTFLAIPVGKPYIDRMGVQALIPAHFGASWATVMMDDI